ncbi:MAG: alpha-mannosidase [Candidatus Hydrogenedentes bacterium]|nr:alpha-mannosidase [Candidatus Hydrogenedentota bacterium]
MPNLDAERKIEAVQIRRRIREIEETIYRQRTLIQDIQAVVTGPGKGPERMPRSGWKPFKVLTRWGGFDQTTWFKINVTVPAAMKGHRVVALVRLGGESLAYLNGKPSQGLDNNRDEIYLVQRATGGERFQIVLESVPSVRFDEHHYFQYADLAVMHPQVWDFYWDCQVAYEVWETLPDNYAPQRQLMDLLASTVKSIDLQHKGQPAYYESIVRGQRMLRNGLKGFETSYGMGKLILAGHAHIDTAWLWPLRETERKCGRTFSTVLNLMERYPEYHFSCSQPAQYEWMKRYYPEIYAGIKKRVREGRWEPCGAPWVEPDCNMPSGESLVRQFLFGNRFFRKEFGVHSRLAWQPDAFGYSWSMPQIMKKAQIEALVTTKIDWSRFTQFPYSFFQWEGVDGTRVLGVMPPLNYNGNPLPKDCVQHWNLFKQKEKVDELPFSFGWGDGGGGPTMNMLEHGRRLRNVVGIPKCEFGRIQDCVDRMRDQVKTEELPVWNGELYLELHRGCQTTQGRTKRNNRQCEVQLHDAELLSSLASIHGIKYDSGRLNEVWKTVLTNQFHDILPGSSITEVYTQAERDYAAAKSTIEQVTERAVTHLAERIDTRGEGVPLIVFNTLSWVRDDVARARLKLPKGHFMVVDQHGAPVAHQKIGPDEILFEASGFPPLGYAVFRVVSGSAPANPSGMLKAEAQLLENDFLRIRLDKRGTLTSIYDKGEHREVLAEGQRGNVLQLFDDRPHAHDAWDIDHNFDEIMWEPRPAERIEVLEKGPVRAVIRLVRTTEKSTITQDITLYASRARVDFVTQVDWWEKKALLKVAFPVEVHSTRATYEIQFATIERSTHHNTAFDRARFEVAAQRWADLSEGDYGVSLLNDCKYGYDVKGNVLRLSLLRSPVEPDPKADEGKHVFTYSIYPHAWGWRNGTVQEAAQLSVPLVVQAASAKGGPLPSAYTLASVDAGHVILDTVKRAEDSNALIFRLYEAYGQRGEVTLTFARPPRRVSECDLMEENDLPVKLRGATVKFRVKPYELRTFKVTF